MVGSKFAPRITGRIAGVLVHKECLSASRTMSISHVGSSILEETKIDMQLL